MESDLGNDYLSARSQELAQADDPRASVLAILGTQGQKPDPNNPNFDDGEGDGWQRWLKRASGVAEDIGKGVFVEGPGAVQRGAAGAVKEMAGTLDEMGAWLNENVMDLTVGNKEDALANSPLKWISERADEARDLFFGERETNTGRAIEFTAQWLTAGGVVGKAAKGLGIPTNAYTRLVKDLATGASGFDPKDKRLSNVIDEMAPNDFTAWLKASDDDPALLGRLKSGLENAGLGKAAEGVLHGLKLLKNNVFKAKPAPVIQSAAKAAASTADEIAPIVFKGANSNQQFSEQAAKFLSGKLDDLPIQVNVERFAGDADIKKAIGDLSKLLPKQDAIPMETTIRAANSMGITPEQLTEGLAGKIFDRRQITAGWMVFQGSAKKVQELAHAARSTGSAQDVAKFNAAFETSYGVLQTVKGQSSEIARALQIHNALRQSTDGQMKALEKMIEDGGGRAVTMEMAERIASLGDPSQVAQFIKDSGRANTRDQIVYVWSNALLSNPATHIVNIGDTSVSTLMQVPETWFASRLGGDVAQGEATAKLYGIVQGARDGLKMAARTLKTGESAFAGGNKTARGEEISRGVFGVKLPANSNDLQMGGQTRYMADYLKMLIPTRLMHAGDELTKSMNYRGELQALAWREAAKQGEGKEAAAYAKELADNPPEWLKDSAAAQALKGTFNDPLGKYSQKLLDIIDRSPAMNPLGIPVGRIMVATFIKTPAKIAYWSLTHSPAAWLSPAVRADIVAGGATRDMALARIAVGSAIMGTFADLTMQGTITGTGPKDPVLRQRLMDSGWQPYSMGERGKMVSYNRSGTVGTLIGVAADATELLSGVYFREKDTVNFDGEPVEESTLTAATIPFANAVLSKSYSQQLVGLINTLSDPQRYGEGYFRKLAGGFVPSVVGAVERAVDPEIRRAQDWLEAVQARTPGLSDSLPPKLNLRGDPISDHNGIWNLFLPAKIGPPEGTPLDAEIVRLKLGIEPPKQIQSFSVGRARMDVKLSPEQHNQLIASAGRPAYDYLNSVIEGKAGEASIQWNESSDERREIIIKEVFQRYRAAAKQQLIGSDDGLRSLVEDKLRENATKIKTSRDAPVIR